MKKYLATIIVAFSVLLLIIICLLIKFNVFLTENILPEVLGFCLDGIFFVALFTWLTDHYSKLRETEKRKELKSTILLFLEILLMWSYFAGTKSRGETERIPSLFKSDIPDLIEHIKSSDCLGGIELLLKHFAAREIQSFKSLLPITAQIGASHLKHWYIIIYHLEAFNEYKDKDKFKDCLLKFLTSVQIFENLSIDS